MKETSKGKLDINNKSRIKLWSTADFKMHSIFNSTEISPHLGS